MAYPVTLARYPTPRSVSCRSGRAAKSGPRRGCPVLFRVIDGEVAGLEDDGAQLGDAAATTVVEVHERKAGPGHGILQERDRSGAHFTVPDAASGSCDQRPRGTFSTTGAGNAVDAIRALAVLTPAFDRATRPADQPNEARCVRGLHARADHRRKARRASARNTRRVPAPCLKRTCFDCPVCIFRVRQCLHFGRRN